MARPYRVGIPVGACHRRSGFLLSRHSPITTGSIASSAGGEWPRYIWRMTSGTTGLWRSRSCTPKSPLRSVQSVSFARFDLPPASNTPTYCRFLDSESGRRRGGELLWYAMPYVEGETLRHRLGRERQLGVEEALTITREVADALDCAHQHGVVHRDVKPENILLTGGAPGDRGAAGVPTHSRVADFGIAKAVAADVAEGRLRLSTAHRDRDRSGDARLYESRAGHWRSHAGRTHGRLCSRLRALRDAGRRAPVHRSDSAGDHREAVLGPGAGGVACSRGYSAAGRRRSGARARQGTIRSVPKRR